MKKTVEFKDLHKLINYQCLHELKIYMLGYIKGDRYEIRKR